MNWLANLNDEQRRGTIQVVAESLGLPVAAVEKDWWVCLALRALFSTSLAGVLLFKGGTSLSKGWNLIQRFSEDIDLALDREALNFGGQLTTKQIEKLRKASEIFVSGELSRSLIASFVNLNVPPIYEVTHADDDLSDPHLLINYSSLFDPHPYLPPRVKIEISTRSMMEPSSARNIRSFIGTHYDGHPFSDPAFEVPTVEPRRTFLEKAFLIHEELLRSPDQMRVLRMSRHLSDLERLMDTSHATQALENLDLYNDIVSHRSVFYKRGHVDYNTLAPHLIDFVPSQVVREMWEADYTQMQPMFYGETLAYAQLTERLATLRQRFRQAAAV